MDMPPGFQARLQMLYIYEPRDGHLYHRGQRHGKKAGTQVRNRWQVIVDGQRIRLHLAVWAWHGFPDPQDGRIEHANGDTLDCRIENLRFVPANALTAGGSAPVVRAQQTDEELEAQFKRVVQNSTKMLRAELAETKRELEGLKAQLSSLDQPTAKQHTEAIDDPW